MDLWVKRVWGMGTFVETLVNASTPCPYPLPPPPTHIYFAILIDLNHDTEPRHEPRHYRLTPGVVKISKCQHRARDYPQ